MDISDITNAVDHSEFGKEFLEIYLERGIGSLSKRDIDVLVLKLLEKHANLELTSNHELSLALRLTETRVRSLRYEANLKYPPSDQNFLKRRLLFILAKAEYEADAHRIVFVVEDSFIRKSLQAHLKKKGGFADSSFNSELVRVSPSQLAPVLQSLFGKPIANDFCKAMDAKIEKDKFANARNNFVLGAAKALGGGAVQVVKGLLGTI
jgi:hypothetical protein